MNNNFEGTYESGLTERELNQIHFEEVINLIQKEYFENFLNKFDETVPESTFQEIKEKTGTDILGIIESVDCKITTLLEKISDLSKRSDVTLVESNSLRDILGNSVMAIFRTFYKVANNYDTPEMQAKINDNDSNVRAILNLFSKETADYYLDSLCTDEGKLLLELTTTEGYLGTHPELFLQFPMGSKKTFYFKFLGELEKGNITKENIEEMLAPLDEKIIDKDAVRKSELLK